MTTTASFRMLGCLPTPAHAVAYQSQRVYGRTVTDGTLFGIVAAVLVELAIFGLRRMADVRGRQPPTLTAWLRQSTACCAAPTLSRP